MDSRTRARTYATVVALSIGAVMAFAIFQHLVVLQVALEPQMFVTPTLVGGLFGVLIARIVIASRVEHDLTVALAAREKHISELNSALEARVRERTEELEAKTDALLQSQRLEAVGRLAGGVAHDLNNILAVIFSVADVMQQHQANLPEPQRALFTELTQELSEAMERARGVTAQLLTLSRARTPSMETVELSAVVRRSTAMLRRLLPATVTVDFDAPDKPCFVVADAVQLEQVLLNLAVNARDAMPTGGTYRLSVALEGHEVVLRAADTGTGMDEATLAHAFDAFFTTKPSGKGTGLGLAIVAEVVRRASGTVAVASAPGRGTTFTLRFPLAPPPVVSATSGPVSKLVRGEGQTLLVIEDDAAVRRQLVNALGRAGFRVLEAASAAEAERWWTAEAANLRGVVCDVVLASESGPSVMRRLRARGPLVPVLFMSGYSEQELDAQGTLDGAPMLTKPFTHEELLTRLARLMTDAPR